MPWRLILFFDGVPHILDTIQNRRTAPYSEAQAVTFQFRGWKCQNHPVTRRRPIRWPTLYQRVLKNKTVAIQIEPRWSVACDGQSVDRRLVFFHGDETRLLGLPWVQCTRDPRSGGENTIHLPEKWYLETQSM